MKQKIGRVVYLFFIILFLALYFISIYLDIKFKLVTTDQLIYALLYNNGSSFSAIKDGVIFVTICTLLTTIFLIIVYKLLKKKQKLVLYNEKHLRYIFMVFLMLISFFNISKSIKLFDYVKSQEEPSKIFEDYYVPPKDVKIEFPNDKQNLIYIVVESLETTNATIASGGGLRESYIPKLEQFAKENTNFSNNDLLGGAMQVTGTGWTAASLIAQTTGIPLKMDLNNKINSLIPGTYSIGEVLESNGYNNYFLLGSNATFGGRKDFFELHGNYKIMDYNYAKKNNWISKGYYNWWGFEDSKLYEFAKKELTNISKKDKPFNFTILTADTHFPDGYVDKSCDRVFKSNYANSIYCTDTMLSNFIEWIKNQDFYSNTTIVIVGDHLAMQSDLYDRLLKNDFQRTVYNTVINSRITAINNLNRKFSLMDMYPTTLAALGVSIEGDKLGLGTNLYSDEKTLFELLGYDYVKTNLNKKSLYYDNKLQNFKE